VAPGGSDFKNFFLRINWPNLHSTFKEYMLRGKIFVSVIQRWIHASGSWSTRSLARCRRRY